MTTNSLPVPGATLHYEVRGSGPLLLLICGGVYDGAGYGPLAAALEDRYTVVTYDRRGNGRSPLDGPPEAQRIEVHADDAHRILEAVGPEPAFAFGNSSGAMIGLELAARHGAQVRMLVCHEPPLFDLLPERDRFRALTDQVETAFHEQGVEAAGETLNAGLQMRGGEPTEDEPGRAPGGGPADAPDPEIMAMMGRMPANMAFFLGYEVGSFARWAPDFAALQASGVPIVPAAGVLSEGEPPHRAAYAVGERLAIRTVIFPGDHGGFGADVPAFSAKLDEVLA